MQLTRLQIALAASLAAGVGAASGYAGAKLTEPTTEAEPKSGTWICVSPTGQLTAVESPSACGADDEILWCTNWVSLPDGNETCARES